MDQSWKQFHRKYSSWKPFSSKILYKSLCKSLTHSKNLEFTFFKMIFYQLILLKMLTIDYPIYNYTDVSYLQLIWLSLRWQILRGNLCLWVNVTYCRPLFFCHFLFQTLKSEPICLKKGTIQSSLSFNLPLTNSSLPTYVQLLLYINYQFDSNNIN